MKKGFNKKEKEALALSAFKDDPSADRLYVSDNGTVLTQEQYEKANKPKDADAFERPAEGEKSEAVEADPEVVAKLEAAEAKLEESEAKLEAADGKLEEAMKQLAENATLLEEKTNEVADLKAQLEAATKATPVKKATKSTKKS